HIALAREIPGGQTRAPRKPVVAGQRDHEWASGKSFRLQISVRRPRAHESDVHSPRLDGSNLWGRIQGLDVDLDLSVDCAEATEDPGNGHELGPRGARDGETITLASRRPPRGEHRTVRLGENLPHMIEKQSTSGCQSYPPFGAIEQPDLDLLLQLLDLLTEGRLRDMEALGGPTEM